jgi:hypothetical protein
MARHLLDPGKEKHIHGMKWKHGDAMIAALGERIVALDFFPPYHGHHGTFRSLYVNWKGAYDESTSRPVVSWILNRSEKAPDYGMGTETCTMHEALPPRKVVDIDMDGCRFRDDMVSTRMSSKTFPGALDLFEEGSRFRAYGAADHDGFFHPKRYDDDDVKVADSLDAGKFDTMTRFFSAFPGKVAPLFGNTTIMVNDITAKRLSRAIDKIADERHVPGGTDSPSMRRGIEIIFRLFPDVLVNEFSGTNNPILARGVAIAATRDLHKRYGLSKKYRGTEQFGRVQDIAKDVAAMNNPAIGDAIVALLVEGSNAIPKDVRCLVASDISARKTGTEKIKYILASEQGYKASDEYYDKNCHEGKK